MWKRLHVKCPLFLSDFNKTLIFSTTFIWNISHSKKNSARYCHNGENVFMWSIRYSFRILNFLGTFSIKRKFKYQVSAKPFQWEPSCSMWMNGRTGRQTDGHDEANSRFSQFCERAYKWYVSEISKRKCPYNSVSILLPAFCNCFESRLQLYSLVCFVVACGNSFKLNRGINWKGDKFWVLPLLHSVSNTIMQVTGILSKEQIKIRQNLPSTKPGLTEWLADRINHWLTDRPTNGLTDGSTV